MNYLNNKNERAKQAKVHIDEMQEKYEKEIQKSIENTEVIDLNNIDLEFDDKPYNPKFIFLNTDTVSAIMKYSDKDDVCVLNFASYKNPGGCFLKGSSAQEESLCHESDLYNVISTQSDYYEYNKKHLNKSMYTDRMLYSKDILFIRDNKKVSVDVLTCAAPNYSAASRFNLVTKDQNSMILKRRIECIKYVLESHNAKIAILGAFGCGVFRQDPFEVAKDFKDIFKHTKIETLVFAVPGNDRNTILFKKICEN